MTFTYFLAQPYVGKIVGPATVESRVRQGDGTQPGVPGLFRHVYDVHIPPSMLFVYAPPAHLKPDARNQLYERAFSLVQCCELQVERPTLEDLCARFATQEKFLRRLAANPMLGD
jgi:hypothetical protein